MRELNGNVPWRNNANRVAKVDFDKRYSNYIKITDLLDEKDDLCDLDLKIEHRIGSNSQNAEVYLSKNIAIKVMPIINENSYANNEKEIRISLQLSTMVLERRSIHFPIVYSFSECKNTTFQNTRFNRESIRYQKGKTRSHIIYYEVAKSDLDQYIKSLTKDEFTSQKNYIYSQCMEAITDLHSVGICHNDLHLRNFLVLPYECKEGYIILITDFGFSDYRTAYQELDCEFFRREWENLLNDYKIDF